MRECVESEYQPLPGSGRSVKQWIWSIFVTGTILIVLAMVFRQPSNPANVVEFRSNIQADPIPNKLSGVPSASEIHKEHFPGYPECQERIDWLKVHWNETAATEKYYRGFGMDGTLGSFLTYLNQNGLYCPLLKDAIAPPIRGVNLGGWFVLEPWIKPSLFEQFDPAKNVRDQWDFCAALGPEEASRQLKKHWDTWLTQEDVKELAEGGISHVRIPVGYWIMGDIRDDEPWVVGELPYLQRAMKWFTKYHIKVVFDLHCGPGSQNGFDNSGHAGSIHWADSAIGQDGQVIYPNLERSFQVIEALVSMFALTPFTGVVEYIELINEAFVTIPIDIVKYYYNEGYKRVRRIDPNIGIVIGDSFRFGDTWDNFMYPPSYNHVYIDTHIYHVFDLYRLGLSWQQHIDMTCQVILPSVAIAPLSTVVGEWSLADTDCAKWLNGAHSGSRYDGTFPPHQQLGSCKGLNDTSTYTPEYKAFLLEFANAQMEAFESGSAQGWFFWNFKTEQAPQWNYLQGLREGYIPRISDRVQVCLAPKD